MPPHPLLPRLPRHRVGCGDGPPLKLTPAEGKSDRKARRATGTELRPPVVERDPIYAERGQALCAAAAASIGYSDSSPSRGREG